MIFSLYIHNFFLTLLNLEQGQEIVLSPPEHLEMGGGFCFCLFIFLFDYISDWEMLKAFSWWEPVDLNGLQDSAPQWKNK